MQWQPGEGEDMHGCLRPHCSRPALAGWWLLGVESSAPLLLNLDDGPVGSEVDQRLAEGWDALGWAERIAPEGWGSVVEADVARSSGMPPSV
jgi:hypothetical protein